jgi:hypothetical protein
VRLADAPGAPATPVVLGTVVRLQVQRSPLKQRPAGSGPYDPGPLLEVPALEVGPRGCTGLLDDGAQRVVDVHCADHPQSRHARGVNGLSVLPAAHYARLRADHGPHLVDGVAGENVLLDGGPLTEADLAGRLLLEVDEGVLEVTGTMAAPPCVEFTQHVLRRPVGDVGPEVQAGLEELDGGTRGFYLRLSGTGTLRAGCRVLRA